MQRKPFLLATLLLAGCSSLAAHAAAKRPMTFNDLMAMKRLGEPIPSPDGKWVAFEQTDVNLEGNTKRAHLWIVPADGGEARRLNPGCDNVESRPRFSPDGKSLLFAAKVGDNQQLWITPFDAASGKLGGSATQLTELSTGADGAIWSPDGQNVVFVSSVYPDAKDDAENKARDEALEKSKVKAKVFTRLFYRHWSSFTDFKRSHLFVVPAVGGVPRDLTPGDHDVPPFSLGGQDMYAVSPDGQELAYTSNIDEVEATSTNNEIFVVPVVGGQPKKLSISPGSDSTPLYSPDGKYLAWRTQARAGFEADKFALTIYKRADGTLADVTSHFDRAVDGIAWSPDSSTVFLTAEDYGQAPLYALPISAGGGTEAQPIELARVHAGDLAASADGKRLYFSRTTAMMPSELAYLDLSKQDRRDVPASEEQPLGTKGKTTKPDSAAVHAVTHVNDALLAELDLSPWESFTFPGAGGATVQGFLMKPPGFDGNKKYPLKFLIHGGPQGAWSDSWSYRWNPELFAATGYVVVAINPHGPTGYGQAFCDAVSGDWGGKPYEDLMKGLDYVEATYPFVDKNREAAMGASYGGYMINWILGHNDRFKCLVSHDGLFNAVAAYGATEELWFNEWEYKGTPWDHPETYAKWSPHQFAKNFKTPTLVIHGQLDYRLDVSQGFDLFTTLQRLKVPSEMLYFPDEGHWVLKPQNSQLWNKTASDWVDRWTAAK